MLTGQCYCGAIQYRVDGPISHRTVCHCAMCRGTTGAPCVAWVTAARTDFQLVHGVLVQFRSSEHATRGFCGACGTQLTFADDTLPDEIDVTTCSLHDAASIGPEYITWVDSALPWMETRGHLPRYRRGSLDGDPPLPSDA